MEKQVQLPVIDLKEEKRKKEKIERMEVFFQDPKFLEALFKDLKDWSDYVLKRYLDAVKETREWNKKCEKYQPETVIENPESFCAWSKEIAYQSLRDKFPDELVVLCIKRGYLVPDGRTGFIFNQLEALK